MNDFTSDHIRITLTDLANKVIESDRIIFGASANCNLTYGAIINKIIANYDDDFALNINLLSARNEIVSNVIRLQNRVIDALNNIDVKRFANIRQFVKCLLETYARLPFIDREKLILKNIIHKIEFALAGKKNLRVIYKGTPLTIAPISISPAKEGSFQYLIGYKNDSLISIRLSRIEDIVVFGKAYPISDKIIARLDAELSEFGPTFVSEPSVKIKVRLSPKGVESYKYSIIHRPIHIKIENDDTYVFRCSETQALYFFFRFAGDAEILEPLSLRDKMRGLYEAGLNNYLN